MNKTNTDIENITNQNSESYIKKLEKDIESLENEINDIDTKINKVIDNYEELDKLYKTKLYLCKELDALMETWIGNQ